MKLIVGLGNPGPEYARTRHNIGFVVVDRLAERYAPGAVARSRFHGLTMDATLGGTSPDEMSERTLLIKPTTYMNRSGQSVGEALRYYKLDPAEDLLVIVDDIALPSGRMRLRAGGSAGGHNGLTDITRALGTDGYARLRIGVDAPGRVPQSDYVLGKFSPDQWSAIEPVLPTIDKLCVHWATSGVESAMNAFNVNPPKPKKSKPQNSKRPEGDGTDSGADSSEATHLSTNHEPTGATRRASAPITQPTPQVRPNGGGGAV